MFFLKIFKGKIKKIKLLTPIDAIFNFVIFDPKDHSQFTC